MPDYIMLFRLTHKGVENIKEAPQRVKDSIKMFEANGAKVKAFYAILGRFDSAFLVEAPDDETIAKLSLQLAVLGNVHTESMRAFSEDQFAEMINKIT